MDQTTLQLDTVTTPTANDYLMLARAGGNRKILATDLLATDVDTTVTVNVQAGEISDTVHASLSAAVAAIGATPATLVISTSSFSSGASCTVPSTLLLRFVGNGSISVVTGNTVTIQSDPTQWPVRKIFYNATAGLGTISFSSNKVMREAYPEWWGAGVGVLAATNEAAFDAGIEALGTLGGGGTLSLGPGVYQKTGAINPGTKALIIQGQGWSTLVGAAFGDAQWLAANAIAGTVIQVTGTSAGILVNGTNHRNLILRDLAILGPGSGSSVGINFNGATTSAGNCFQNVLVANFATGLRVYRVLDSSTLRLKISGCTTGILVTSTDTTDWLFDVSDIQYCTVGILGQGGTLIKFRSIKPLQNNTTGISLNPDIAGGMALWTFEDVWSEANTTSIALNTTTGPISALTFKDCRESTGYTLAPTLVSALNRVTVENCEWSGVPVTLDTGANDWVFIRSSIGSLTVGSAGRISRTNTSISGQASSSLGSAAFALTAAATVTPNYNNGDVQELTMDQNTTLNAPTNAIEDTTITYILRQNGTGGWTVTWGAGYHVSWSDTGNTAFKYSTISFRYIGSGQWVQLGAQAPYFS